MTKLYVGDEISRYVAAHHYVDDAAAIADFHSYWQRREKELGVKLKWGEPQLYEGKTYYATATVAEVLP